MALTIELLHLGDVYVERAFEVKRMQEGRVTRVPTFAYLINGANAGPILVDTGFRTPEIMETIGMRATVSEGQGLEHQLAARGLAPKDIRYILHTHLHIDHAGRDDIFPMSTTAIVNRAEISGAAGGLAGWAYPAQDVKHIIDRIYTRDGAWLLDVEPGCAVELFDGIAVEFAGGHSAGSINIMVETDDGIAKLCGDVIYSIRHQCLEPYGEKNHFEPRISGNTVLSERDEKKAIKKALHPCRWLLPSHDMPIRIAEGGRTTVDRYLNGPVVPDRSGKDQHDAGQERRSN